jgi:ABC-type polysaccharide/polyol phosphate transport system ATPase subunit
VSEPAVEVEGVSKRFRLYHDRNQSVKAAVMRGRRAKYEEFWALRDVSLEVPAGTTFGLIGENGSGKSTLLKCMARILRPDEGSLRTHGKVSALLELGAGFHPELSGRDNVFLNGAILGMSHKEIGRRFDDIVGFAGLERFIDTPVKNYSSGMYVRLGFSVAINVDPDVLLVDEVLAVGDEQFQRRCAEKFAELRGKGKTIVVVSHSLGTVQQMCDGAAWLDHGVLRSAAGTARRPRPAPRRPAARRGRR